MKVKMLVLACIITCSIGIVAGFAQSGGGDPLSGLWSGDWGPSERDRNQVTVALKWDGKALSGMVNPGTSSEVRLDKTTFDPATNAVHMEAHVQARGGRMFHYIIDGKVQNGTMTGTWNHENVKGDFKITKK